MAGHRPTASDREQSRPHGCVHKGELKFDDGEYVDGYVYNPRDGKTPRIEMKVLDRETLTMRGYMGISLLGQSQIWKRAHAAARVPTR